MAYTEKTYQLNSAGIDAVSEDVRSWLESMNVDQKEKIRIRLTVEELLLRISEHAGGETVTGTLRLGKRLGAPYISFRYDGERFDPRDTDADDWSAKILTNLGLAPTWRFRSGFNELMVRLPSAGHKSEIRMVCAFLAAIVLGLAGSTFTPGLTAALSDYILTPLSDMFLHLLNAFAGLMVFLSVMTGICGLGNSAELGRVGRVMISRNLFFSFAGAAATIALGRPFYSINAGASAGGTAQVKEIIDLVLNILPSNPVQPFVDGNMMQIIFLAFIIGCFMLLVGERSKYLQRVVSDCNSVVIEIMAWVCQFLPVYIFASLTLQLWESGAGMMAKIWKPVLIGTLITVLLSAVKMASSCFKLKVSFGEMLKVHLPALIIGLTTASSVSAYRTNTEICNEKLGVAPEYTSMALPIGMSLQAGIYSSVYVMTALFCAEYYDVEVGSAWYLMLMIMGVVLSVAAPPVSGGMIACLNIMMLQLNIPAGALAVSVTISVLLDFVCTGLRLPPLDLEIAVQADRLGMREKEKI